MADAFSLLINATMDEHADEDTWIVMFLNDSDDPDDGVIYYTDYVDVEEITESKNKA